MKTFIASILAAMFMLTFLYKLFSQSEPVLKEFGITTGALSNFPANQNYFKDNMSVFYVAPFVRAGRHEFSAGLMYPLKAQGLYFNNADLDPRLGATAGYKYYIFDPQGRENLFVHYCFQYLRYKGQVTDQTETDMYINNVIGLGYNIFFDMNARFGFYYTLDYVITQNGYNIAEPGYTGNSWITKYVWNYLSTNIGFSFKLTPIKAK
jgi:hypothetical protein